MFIESFAPKAEATKHLDKYSRKLCPSLKHFVIFSSVSCGRGSAAQSSYGMANSIMERICEKRQLVGLPAKAIQWGAIGDVGILTNSKEFRVDMEIVGTLPQGINSCLEVLDNLLMNNDPIVASMVVAEKHFYDVKKGNIVEAIMNIMTIRDKKQISMDATLSKLGMDSLMGVEIQQILERDYDIALSSQELRSLSLGQLEKLANSKNSGESTVNAQMSFGIEMLLNNFGDEKQSHRTVLKVNDIPISDTKILIISGIEGMNNDSLKALAKHLKHPAYVLQFGNSSKPSTLDEIVENVKNVS